MGSLLATRGARPQGSCAWRRRERVLGTTDQVQVSLLGPDRRPRWLKTRRRQPAGGRAGVPCSSSATARPVGARPARRDARREVSTAHPRDIDEHRVQRDDRARRRHRAARRERPLARTREREETEDAIAPASAIEAGFLESGVGRARQPEQEPHGGDDPEEDADLDPAPPHHRAEDEGEPEAPDRPREEPRTPHDDRIRDVRSSR